MQIDFSHARESLGKAVDALMLADDAYEAIADAFQELNLAFSKFSDIDLRDSAIADIYEKLQSYGDISQCTWVSRRHLEKAQTLSRVEKKDFCRCLLHLYTTIEAESARDNAA